MMLRRCRRCEPFHFELRGWRQIVGFDAFILALAGVSFWAGYVTGSHP